MGILWDGQSGTQLEQDRRQLEQVVAEALAAGKINEDEKELLMESIRVRFETSQRAGAERLEVDSLRRLENWIADRVKFKEQKEGVQHERRGPYREVRKPGG